MDLSVTEMSSLFKLLAAINQQEAVLLQKIHQLTSILSHFGESNPQNENKSFP